MKKTILVLLAAIAFSCGDGSNRSSERDDGFDDMDNTETLEPDTTFDESDQMRSDTSSTWDQDRDDYNRQDTTVDQ